MILMIDEETRRMSIVKEYLEEAGFQVSLIDNVDEACKFIQERFSDLKAIILDIMMPWGTLFTAEDTEVGIITGYKLYKKIRKNHGYKIPVIVYTALQKPDLLYKLRKEENCSVISKDDFASKITIELEKYGIRPMVAKEG